MPHKPMTDEQLREIEQRLQAATPGPWTVKPDIRPDVVTDYMVRTEHGQGGYCDEGQITTGRTYGVIRDGSKHVAELAKNYGKGNSVPGDAFNDADLIAHAPTDIAALIAEVRRLRDEQGEAQ